MTGGEQVHRVTIVNAGNRLKPPPQSEDGEPPRPSHDAATAQLCQALEDLLAEVRDRGVGSFSHDGLLLDVVMGNFHVMCFEHSVYQQIELSPREQQIALMVARGRTNQAIASALEISVWTVSTHLRRIFAKLAVSSRAEMVAHLLAQSEFASQIGRTPQD